MSHGTASRAIARVWQTRSSTYDERLVIANGFTAEAGGRAVDTLLARQVPFTAIACANDLLALGALQRLHALGIDVPRDVSVAGFDDIPTAAMTAPSLSTVRLPLREMGRRGFAYADRVLNGETPEHILMPTEVVMRDSTGTPPATPLGGTQ